MKPWSAVLTISMLLFAASAVFADGIDFTSNVSLSQLKTINGDYVSYTGKGGVLGQHIPITEIGTGGRMVAVTGSKCGGMTCGWLNFTTGTLLSTSASEDVFAGGGDTAHPGDDFGRYEERCPADRNLRWSSDSFRDQPRSARWNLVAEWQDRSNLT
jgi:hypothetical protein